MFEEKPTVVEEVVADAQQEEQQDISPEAQPPSKEVTEDKTQDRNWREMRRTVEELKNHNYALQAEVAKINAPAPEPEPIDPRDDDISTIGETKKLFRQNEKELEKLKEDIRRREAQTVEERVRLKYADYDAVVNKENLERLFTAAPELVNMLKATTQDPYAQALGAYKLMKKFGVVGEETEKFKENQTKPRSVNSVGQTSALSQANAFSRGLTPDLRKQLWNEMKEAAKKA
jgi:hypothetical protein